MNAKLSIAHEDRGFQYTGENGYPADGKTYTAEIIAWSYDEEGMPKEDTFNFTVTGGKVSIMPNPLKIKGTGRATVIISTVKDTPQTVEISEGENSCKVYLFMGKLVPTSPPHLPLDQDNKTTINYKMEYNIFPKKYVADSVEINISKGSEIIKTIEGNCNSDSGYSVIQKGTILNPNIYKKQLRINRNTDGQYLSKYHFFYAFKCIAKSVYPNILPAKSKWPRWRNLGKNKICSLIEMKTEPKRAFNFLFNDIDLSLLEIKINGNYKPKGNGIIKKLKPMQWSYEPFIEPRLVKYPVFASVYLMPKYYNADCGQKVILRVYPVFEWLVYHSGNGYMAHNMAIDYVCWKYRISRNKDFYSPLLTSAAASTNWLTKITIYGKSAFTSENMLISTIIHEHVHKRQKSRDLLRAWLSAKAYNKKKGNGYDMAKVELPAYQAELNNAWRTGLRGSDLEEVKEQIRIMEEILKKYDHEERWDILSKQTKKLKKLYKKLIPWKK